MKKKYLSFFLILVMAFITLAACGIVKDDSQYISTDGDTRVYFMESSYKVELTQREIESSRTSLEIIMCKNEYEGGQFVIRNDFSNIKNAKISVSELSDESGNVIDSSRVCLYRERYINVYEYYGKSIYNPDALIPMEYDDLNCIDINQGENQPYYVRVRTNETDSAGTYTATVKVEFDGGYVAVPMTVVVYDITIPTAPATTTDFGAWTIASVYEGTSVDATEARTMLYEYMRDYRLSLSYTPYRNGTNPDEYVKNIAVYAADPRITKIAMPIYATNDEEGFYVFDVEKMQQLAAALREYGLIDKAYWSVVDEPTDQHTFDIMIKFNRDLIAIIPEAHHTTALRYTNKVPADGLETWCLSWDGINKTNVSKLLGYGSQVWRYGTEETLIGNQNLVEAKIRFWHQAQLGITGYVQWAADCYMTYATEPYPPKWNSGVSDFWNDPYCFFPPEVYPIYYGGGDSYVVYPGKEGDGIVNRNIIVGSIRLEAIRDGVDDYDLLQMRRAQIEEQLKEYGSTTSPDKYMQLYYDSLNDITNDTSGTSLSNFERYSIIKKQLLDDIIQNNSVLVSVEMFEDKARFDERTVTVLAPVGSDISLNGNTLVQNEQGEATALIKVTDVATELSFTVNGKTFTKSVYPKLTEVVASAVNLTKLNEIVAANPKLSSETFSLDGEKLVVDFSDNAKSINIASNAFFDENGNFEEKGTHLCMTVKNLSEETLDTFMLYWSSGPSRGTAEIQTTIEPGQSKVIYFDLASANIEYNRVTKLVLTFNKNVKIELSDIQNVNVK